MGIAVAWIAVRGVTPEVIMETVGLEPIESVLRKQAHVGQLEAGWALYVDYDFDRAFREPLDRLVALGAPTVAGREEPHVMYSEARGYDAGRELWQVVRDSATEPYMHLAVTGEPPAQFKTIRATAFAEQEAEGGEEAGVDMIYDVPLDLVRSICGFRPGEADEPELTPTRRRRPQNTGGAFLARLFGRG